jgi:hypothetical protein
MKTNVNKTINDAVKIINGSTAPANGSAKWNKEQLQKV